MRTLLVSLTLLVAGCSSSVPDDGLAVEWGLSFGECLGYCSARLVVSDDATATLTETAIAVRPSETPPPRVRTRTLTADEQARLVEAAARSRVRTARIGCPGCTDGGVEYVERNGKRVTFEERGDAGGAEPLAEALRAVRAGFPDPR